MQLKDRIFKLTALIFIAAGLIACGSEKDDYGFENPYDELFNDQPDTGFISISSVSADSTIAERNPVTFSWDGADADGIEGYYHRVDGNEWVWTTDTFATYSGLETGPHTFQVKSKDVVGAIDNSPVSKTFDVDATPPGISSTAPRSAEADVPLNFSITAVFNEPMDGSSVLSLSSIELRDDAFNIISGTLDYSYTTLHFRPAAELSANTDYTAVIRTVVKDVVGNPLREDYAWSFTSGSTVDSDLPGISSTIPKRNASDVPDDASIMVRFTEPMTPSSVNAASFNLCSACDGSDDIAGEVFYSGLTAQFIPEASLPENTDFCATIAGTVQDLSGNTMGSDYVWRFTTGDRPDMAPPDVSATSPKNGALDVSPNSSVTATFSEPLDPSSITTGSFNLTDSAGNDVPGAVYYSGVTAAFIPFTSLDYGSLYSAHITTGVRDAAGNGVSSSFVWNFTTGIEPDTYSPSVSSTSPKHNGRGVSVDSGIRVTFNEPMDAYTVSTATFTLQDDAFSANVPGTVTYSGTTATFTPLSSLDFSRSYTATIKGRVRDIAGNGLGADYVWGFITGDAPDRTPPVVMWSNPADASNDAANMGVITATFSEPVDPATVTRASFKLRDEFNNSFLGTVTLNDKTAVFTPYWPLTMERGYTATITTEIRDGAGNRLERDYIWNFTTASIADSLSPSVSQIDPDDGQIDVPTAASVILRFSEPLDPATITTDTVFLHDDWGYYIEGSVYYDGLKTAIFRPLSTLSPTTWHTVGITSGVTDLAGNPFNPFSSVFQTSDGTDVKSPSVAFTDPANAKTSVKVVDPRIYITFSEPMDGATLNGSTILVEDEFNNAVAGNVYYDGVLTALFKPISDLYYDATYTVTVKGEVTDASINANPMGIDYPFTFTTGSVPANIASRISGGYWHSLAVKDDSSGWAWGYNTNGELGDGTNIEKNVPTPIAVISNVDALAAGDAHSLGLLGDGTVWAWGDNTFGQLGIGSYDTAAHTSPVELPGIANVIAVDGGYRHSIALKSDGTVWTWGENNSGQLGRITEALCDGYPCGTSPAQVPGLADIVDIAAGEDHNVALGRDGTVWTWGWNNAGQLGDGSTTDSWTPVQVSGLSGVIDIAAGRLHTLALRNDGTVLAWGWNNVGQLGDRTTTARFTPVQVYGLSGVKTIAAGAQHSLALLSNGTVRAWGLNGDGQVGNTSVIDYTLEPVQVSGLGGVEAIAGGAFHSLALTIDGRAWGWGYNGEGQLGDGTTTDAGTPVEVSW